MIARAESPRGDEVRRNNVPSSLRRRSREPFIYDGLRRSRAHFFARQAHLFRASPISGEMKRAPLRRGFIQKSRNGSFFMHHMTAPVCLITADINGQAFSVASIGIQDGDVYFERRRFTPAGNSAHKKVERNVRW